MIHIHICSNLKVYHNLVSRLPRCADYVVDFEGSSKTCLRIEGQEYCRSVLPPYHKVVKLPRIFLDMKDTQPRIKEV